MGEGVTSVPRRLPLGALVALLLAAALVLAAPPARALFQSVTVVITTDQASYSVGEAVNVTVRVFNLAVLTDPTSLVIRVNPGNSLEQVANATRQSVGVYNATVPVNATNVVPAGASSGFIDVEASAAVGSVTDVESAIVAVVPSAALGFVVTPSSFTAVSGSTVDLSLRTTVDGVPENASAVSAFVIASMSFGSFGPVALPVSNVSTGNYSAVLQVPASLEGPALLVVTATAGVAGTNLTRGVYVYVPGPQPFDIWAYQISFLPPVAEFSLFVGDSQGAFVAGANVSLNYTFDSLTLGGTVVRQASAVTDASGRAFFNLDLGGATDVFDVLYRGNVTNGADRQAFSGVLFTQSTNTAIYQILRSNPYSFFDVNTTAELNYSVTAVGHPVSGARIYYYAQTATEFLAAGNVTSDGNGSITVRVPVRAPAVQILLTTKAGSSSWYGTTDFVVPAHPLQVETGPIRIGSAVRVNVTFPYPGTWFASAFLMPYVTASSVGPWSSVSNFFASGSLFPTGSGVSYNLSLPRFLPKDADYLLYVVADPPSNLGSGVAGEAYVYTRIVHIPNLVPQVRENLSTTTPAVGDVVTADVSSSHDPDGFLVGYRVSWGDGNVTPDWVGTPVFTHAFAAPGDYKVSVSVKDDTGAVSITQQIVHVEATLLGLRVSLAIPLLAATAIVVAAVMVVWWMRRRRPTRAPPGPAADVPEGPETPGPPPGTP